MNSRGLTTESFGDVHVQSHRAVALLPPLQRRRNLSSLSSVAAPPLLVLLRDGLGLPRFHCGAQLSFLSPAAWKLAFLSSATAGGGRGGDGARIMGAALGAVGATVEWVG